MISRTLRRLLDLVALSLGLAAVCVGFWTASGSGASNAVSGSLSAATISVPATSNGSNTVTWTQQASLSPSGSDNSAITYTVQRKLGSGAFAAVPSGACAGSLPRPTTSCTDVVSASGDYTYRVEASFRSWTVLSAEAGPVTATVDTTAPTVSSINRSAATPSASASLSWTVTFSETVTGVDASDFSLVRGTGVTGGAITAVSGSGATRTVTAGTGSGSGTLGLNLVDDDTIADTAATPNKLGGTGAGNGNFTGQEYTLDRTPPSLTLLEMLDADLDGKVDRVRATFDETLAATTATAPWTLGSIPSAGTLASVSRTTNVVTLTITEGSGAQDTAVGAFTIALAASSTGVRDALGNQASFTARAPTDKAGPVPVLVADTDGSVAGRIEPADTIAATFSEPLAPASVTASTSATETRPSSGNATLSIPGFTSGALSLGSSNYLSAAGSVAFSATAALGNANKTVTVTLGSCTSGSVCSTLPATGTGTTLSYIPATTLTDPAANAAAGSRATGFTMF